jgi:hypothetical protein
LNLGPGFTFRLRLGPGQLQPSASRHFFHDPVIVGEHHRSKLIKLFGLHAGDQSQQSGVERVNATFKREFVVKEPRHQRFGFAPVGVHNKAMLAAVRRYMLAVQLDQARLMRARSSELHSEFRDFIEVFRKKGRNLIVVNRHKRTHGGPNILKQSCLTFAFFLRHERTE